MAGGRVKSIAAAYRAGELPAFFERAPGDLSAARAVRADVDRAALTDALRAYHQDLGTLDAHVEALLARLAHPRSRAVVTGQQAGLLTGPAYSVHKGADAVLLARQLDEEDSPCVAVYWIASQDHDAEEVASVTLLDYAETLHHLRLELPAGRPVGCLPWRPAYTDQVLALLDAFDAPQAHKAAVRAQVLRAVRGEPGWADVFARLIHDLLGRAGLLVLDPLHPALARLAAPALRRELAHPLSSSQAIEEAAAGLEGLGFTPQLRRPAEATNVFLEGEDGQRRLLHFDGHHFEAERHYTREELLELLERDPSRLTPAAGLRPTVQDTMLPTAAFVVGPGEIGYGAQLRKVYRLHGLRQPLLWPRLSVTWLEPNVARLLTRLDASAAEVQRDPEGSLGRALARERGAAALSAGRLEALASELRALQGEVGALDPTLAGAAQRSGSRVLAQVERLQRLAERALARAEDERSGQLARLRLHLLPRGVPQERELSFLNLPLKHGDAPLRRLLALPAGAQVELRVDEGV